MKQNRADWKAKNYVKEYDAKMKKKAPHEIQKEQRAKNYAKTIARTNAVPSRNGRDCQSQRQGILST